jgi:predicted signal transduction protein with EAL and GGDEF domain
MYQAKAARQGSATFFTEEMNIRLRERMQMEQDLNLAVELGQLTLHFQPIFDAAGSAIAAAEVLLRWHHPEKGAISPAVFIPLAEATGPDRRHCATGCSSRPAAAWFAGATPVSIRDSWRSTYPGFNSEGAFPEGLPS